MNNNPDLVPGEPIAYLRGRYIPHASCVLPIYDAGIVMGAAVTDLIRTYDGIPHAVEAHVKRFCESARYAYLPLPVSADELHTIIDRLVVHNRTTWPNRELAIVLYLTAGELPIYAGSAASVSSPPTLVVHTFPLPFELWETAMREGIHVVTPAQRHLPPNTLSSKIKHRNRLHMWIGDRQAKLVDPQAVGLYLDTEGNVTETGGANFLLYKEGTVYCPCRHNLLWGVSLEKVLQLSAEIGLSVVERDMQIVDVVNADEAWLTTTPYFLAPVTRINGLSIGSGRPGPIWHRLITTFSAEVGVDVLGQILEPKQAN